MTSRRKERRGERSAERLAAVLPAGRGSWTTSSRRGNTFVARAEGGGGVAFASAYSGWRRRGWVRLLCRSPRPHADGRMYAAWQLTDRGRAVVSALRERRELGGVA